MRPQRGPTVPGGRSTRPGIPTRRGRGRYSVRGRALTAPGSGSAPYGADCGAARIAPRGSGHANRPHAGTANFGVKIENAPRGTSAVLLVGTAQSSIPLDFLGLTGCSLYVDPATIAVNLPVALASSQYDVGIRIPSALRGTVYFQWAYVNPSANPFGVETTRGLAVTVR